MKMDRYKEAVDDFTDLLSMDPTLVETYYKRGMRRSQKQMNLELIVFFMT